MFSEMLVVQKSKWLNAPKIIIGPLFNPGPALFIHTESENTLMLNYKLNYAN